MSVPKLLAVVVAHGAPAIEQPVFRLAESRKGAPLWKRVMPETCQPPRTFLRMELRRRLPGTSHR